VYLQAAARRAGEGTAPVSRAASRRPAASAPRRFSPNGSACVEAAGMMAMQGGWEQAVAAGARTGGMRVAGGEPSSPLSRRIRRPSLSLTDHPLLARPFY
jgi:hypothetical protein